VIELVLTPASANRIRFAVSPLEEALGVVQTLLGLRGHPAHLPFLTGAATTAEALPITELRQVLSGHHYITDFLSPPPSGPRTTAQAQLAEVRRAPVEQVAAELAMVDADLSQLPTDPARARDLLADQLELVWTELVAPHWPKIRETLAADIEYRSARLAEGGTALALTGIHPKIRLAGDVLAIESRSRGRLDLDERGLALLPSVFAWPRVGVMMVPPWQPSMLYPARGVAALWTARPVPNAALTAVVGRTKAALLHALDEPATTATLATGLGFAPSTVSEHLTALRAAGLLMTSRRGRVVRYRRTSLGDALLDGSVPRT
jgi:DNA-binding transcriptional ArsR family regulator